ncbi:MAG: Uma2 family endonuclease, partial [Chloroflexi bacterium]|nr:Uma2 family endonuclease [Chloroflexota bacterium]
GYLRGGTSLVWVVWPHRRTVDVWRSSNALRPVATLAENDTLNGEDVVSGFTYPIVNLFA